MCILSSSKLSEPLSSSIESDLYSFGQEHTPQVAASHISKQTYKQGFISAVSAKPQKHKTMVSHISSIHYEQTLFFFLSKNNETARNRRLALTCRVRSAASSFSFLPKKLFEPNIHLLWPNSKIINELRVFWLFVKVSDPKMRRFLQNVNLLGWQA